MDPFPLLLPYEMDSLVRSYVEWDFMSVGQASWTPPENGAVVVDLCAGKANPYLE